MKTIRTMLLFILSSTFIAFSAQSGTKELSASIFENIDWNGVYMNRQKRLEIALDIQNYWKNFDARIPRLSPDELAWIERELDTTDTARISRATQRPEFGLWKLDNHIRDCQSSLSGILEQATETPEIEMFFWLKLINCYDSADEIQRNLQIANLSDGGHDASFYTATNDMLRGIIINRIATSAMADTMNWTLSE